MATEPKHRHHANPKMAEGLALLARSSAAGTHGDRRTKRNRDRSSQRRRAISESREDQ